jgi:branched-subunit amino acid aminotransferase/4-amino-4-deoxychorismate lyase
VREVRFPKERLYEADEVFITSSIREILPVTQVDQKQIGHGKQGRFTQMLHSQFRTMLPNLAVQPEKKTKDSEV